MGWIALGVLAATASSVSGAGPSVKPPWPSQLPGFGSSWFGGSLKAFEWSDPGEMAKIRRYKHVLTGWMPLLSVTNFTNATAMDAEQAVQLKKELGPGVAVFSYQNGWLADGFHDEARLLMEDPAYGDLFLRNASGDHLTDDTYCAQTQTTPASTGGRCLSFFWNWCNSSAIEVYLKRVIAPLVTQPDGTPLTYDGVFLDQSDDFTTRGSSNANCEPREAALRVHVATGQYLASVGKWPIFSSTLSGDNDVAEQNTIWAAGVGYTRFDEFFTPTLGAMKALYNETERGVPTLVHAPTFVKRHPGISNLNAMSAYLVGTGNAAHSYYQYSSGWYDQNWRWDPLFDVSYGEATGPPVVTTYGVNATAPKTGEVWVRKFDHGNITVSVNCTPPEMRIVWCIGDISWPGRVATEVA